MLCIDHVTKLYNGQLILDISDLHLEKGVYWLQGKNGSGKTTFMRMLAGLLPFNGNILLNHLSLIKNRLAYLRLVNFAEAEPLYPDFITGSELLTMHRDIRKASTIQTDMLTGLFKMHSFIKQPVGTYSSGMLKKLSLLLAFIGKPALILLDEPLATLDETSVHSVPELIKAYHKEFGTSFIFSSHQAFHLHAVNTRELHVAEKSVQVVACLGECGE